MTIVTKNSLTLSNVNDGSITHYAYSWSADGTDRFTTIYPNLNLLVNSSAKTKAGFFKNFDKVENGYGEVTIKGTNTWVAIDLSDGFSIQPRGYKPGDKYTMSMDVMFTSWNFPAGTDVGEFWLGQRYTQNSWKTICTINLPHDPSQMLNQWIRITQTSTIPPYEDPSVGTQTAFQTRLNGTSEASFTIRVRKPKQDPGSVATPHMPSSTEVTTADWPNYIGQYTDFSTTASTDPTKYAPWTIFKGNDGKDGVNGKDGIAGKDGIGIQTTTITYAQSTVGTTAPTTGWTSSVPSLVKGQYLWTKTVWTYTDNSSETGYSVTYISKDGNNGSDGVAGKDGNGIKTTTITYVGSTSGTTVPTTGWTTSVPSVPAGQFLWTKTVWTYTDNTSETGYSVAMMGPKGERGKQIFKSNYESVPHNTGHYWSDLSPAPSIDNPPKIGDTVITPSGNILQIDTVNVGGGGGGGTFGVGDVLGNIKGPAGPPGSTGAPGKIVSNTEPTTKFNGLTWKYSGANDITASDGTNILAGTEYYWNGTVWALYEINAHNINGDNLSVTNGTFKDGKIESIWGSNGVNGTTTIESNHLIIHSTDSVANTENTVGLDNEQGYAQVYVDKKTGRTITVQVSSQGFFVSDSTGPYVRVTPNGISTSSDKSQNSFQIGAGITINLERRGDMVEATLSGSINSALSSGATFTVGTIPVGYRPNKTANIMVHMTSSVNSSHIDVGTNGICIWWGASTSSGAPRGTQMWFTNDPTPQ